MFAAPLAMSGDYFCAALARAHAYVSSKQSPRGGFCFYRGYYVEEPNLADTWHGLATLALLDAPAYEPDAHASFVMGQPIEPQPFALYYRVRSLDVLGVDDPMDDDVKSAVKALQVDRFDPAQASFTTSLQRLRCVMWLKKHYGVPVDALEAIEALRASEDASGGFGVPPNVLDTEASMGILQLGGHAVSSRTGAFLQRLATPRFGFRLTEGSLSPNLETTCAGVMGCSRAGIAVSCARDAADFILSCQTGSGGFARTADALPDLALTHMALTTLIVHMSEALHLPSAGRQDGDAG
jgi:hypothetical protein